MNVTIREAGVADAVLIADLSRQTFDETFAAQNTKADMNMFLAEQFTRGRLILEVGKPHLYFFLAYVANEVAGYLKLSDKTPPAVISCTNALEIARIYVVQSYVGKGVGKALIEKSIEIAGNLGKKTLYLGVWEKNKKAIDFYTAWGFTKCGEQDFLLGEDLQKDWLMEKIL
jgi:GNAT superfamily N-acetyltransferase